MIAISFEEMLYCNFSAYLTIYSVNHIYIPNNNDRFNSIRIFVEADFMI